GIIGCGNISTTYCRLAPMFAPLDLRAVADIDMNAASERGAAFDLRVETVDGLLAASDIDIVVNLTIPAVHYQVTRKILAAGKHAYSEKPLVLTLSEAEDLRELAAAKGLAIGSAPDTFLGGAHQKARASIDAGDIGRIVGGTCHVMSHGMESWHPNPDFFFQPGAGPMLDIGPYYITNLIHLIGPVKSVAAMASTTFATRTIGSGDRAGQTVPVATPTNIHALLECANGATVTLGTSWDVWAHRHGPMELYGETGSLFVPDPNFFGGDVEISHQGGPIKPLAPWNHPFGQPNEGDLANYRCAGLADMAAAIAAGRAHRCNIDLAVHAVDVMTSILRAAQERRPIDLKTSCERPEPLLPSQAASLVTDTPG
ncbi:MAG: Gfo/Idh/MocA family oxidoreductase, partial [Pseudomonadota bacterium]